MKLLSSSVKNRRLCLFAYSAWPELDELYFRLLLD